MSTRNVLVAAIAAYGLSGPLQAQLRCDCTSVVDTCSADVTVKGSFIDIKSDSKQCSRVDYFVDGLPFVSVVVDGEDRQSWIPRTAAPKVLVQSCQICRDLGTSPAPQTAPSRPKAPGTDGSAEPGSEKLEPLISSVPQYPAAAAARGTAGHVDVEFTVTPQGTVENVHVTGAQPRRVFDAAAIAAVARRRYPADPQRAATTLQETLNFRPPAAPAATTAAGITTGPRNQCIRENAVYNYGETVDVGLMSTCGGALLVYGCAQGTGKYAGRWVCTDSEEQGNLLVREDDPRIGQRTAVTTVSGARTFAYADTFVVTRAPNSEYWWVACSLDDERCRSTAEQWLRSVDGQPASVDPADRSPIAVARSY
jgi:TonB family protein